MLAPIRLLLEACVIVDSLLKRSVQQEQTSFFRGTKLYTGLHFELWNYDKTQTFETVLPIYYSMDLSNYLSGLALDLVTSPTFATIRYGNIDDSFESQQQQERDQKGND